MKSKKVIETKNFLLKVPNDKRKTFQLTPYGSEDGKRVYGPSVKDNGLDKINELFLKKEITFEQAKNQIKMMVIPRLKEPFGIPPAVSVRNQISEQNYKIYESYWKSVYLRKKLREPETARYEFLKALASFEPLSLVSASSEEIQRHWDETFQGTRHKRYGGRVNQLLHFIKRDFSIQLDKTDITFLKFVTWEEFEKIRGLIDNSVLQDLYTVLFTTGVRLGEAFAFSPDDLKSNKLLYVSKQMLKTGEIVQRVKNNKKHHTILLEMGTEAFHRWAAIENKEQYRKSCQHPLLDASRKAFPKNKAKHISPHKLRNSFVRYLINKNVPINKINRLLGDSLKTVEDVYAQWLLTDDEASLVLSILEKAPN